MQGRTVTARRFIGSIIVATLLIGCGGRKKVQDQAAEAPPSDSQRIESLSQTLSRAQARIEELDAKVSAMTDKLESTKLTLDNLTNTKQVVPTQLVGSADERDAEAHAPKSKTRTRKSQPAALAAGKASVMQDETAMDFRKGMALFNSGKFSDSELVFDKITESAPEHVLAGSAQFYAGESYYRMHEYKLAMAEFEKVLGTYGTSPRAASAMVRISHCQTALGNAKEAERTMSMAQDLFAGNPSLDWQGPGAAAAPKSLKTEPKEVAHAEKPAAKTEDSSLDTSPMGQPEAESQGKQ